MNILFLGAPGSGKGTQAAIIEQKMNIPQLSTGDLLRKFAESGSELGKQIQNIMTSGELVSDGIIVKMISQRIQEDDCKNGFILDGFPRNITQAKALDEMLKKENISLDRVIEIKVNDEIIVERITGRFSCANCGAGYHDKFKKPKQEGVCDVCGSTEFVRRKDDNEESVRNRLKVYYEQTAPLIEYYKDSGIFYSIDGTQDIEKVEADIENILK